MIKQKHVECSLLVVLSHDFMHINVLHILTRFCVTTMAWPKARASGAGCKWTSPWGISSVSNCTRLTKLADVGCRTNTVLHPRCSRAITWACCHKRHGVQETSTCGSSGITRFGTIKINTQKGRLIHNVCVISMPPSMYLI